MFTVKNMKNMSGVDITVDSIEDHIKQLENAMKVYEEATERFLYAVYLRFEEMLQKRGGNAKGVDYSKLQLIDVGKMDQFTTFALVHPDLQRELGHGDTLQTVVSIRPKLSNDPDLDIMARYSPWPVEALPEPVNPKTASIVSRRVRADEVAARIDELFQEAEVVAWLVSKGTAARIRPTLAIWPNRFSKAARPSMPSGFWAAKMIIRNTPWPKTNAP